jgi:DNA polymerase III epsilon subunit-like protein
MNIMIDIETLGIKPTAPILQIGMARLIGDEIVSHSWLIDIETAGGIIEPATLKWWGKNITLGGTIPLNSALWEMNQYIHAGDLVWAKSPQFDLVIIRESMARCAITPNWSYRQERDLRTLLEGEKVFYTNQHSAWSDAIDQMVALRGILDERSRSSPKQK